MCTAISYKGNHMMLGRNLDHSVPYSEGITVVPRGYPLRFLGDDYTKKHFAFIGMSIIVDKFPLMFDGINEHGVGAVALNLTESTSYAEKSDSGLPYDRIIPYILSFSYNVGDALSLLNGIRVTAGERKNYPESKLHFLLRDRERCYTVEIDNGVPKIYDNPYGTLSNEPSFPVMLGETEHKLKMSEACARSKGDRESELTENGDKGSVSRFIRGYRSSILHPRESTTEESVSAAFHILSSVEIPKGEIYRNGIPHYTLYSSVMDLDTGVYYSRSYNGKRNCHAIAEADKDDMLFFERS